MKGNGSDVVIIGGGVIGLSTAYHLAKKDIRSQVVEMDSIGAKASGCAMGVVTTHKGGVFLGYYVPQWSNRKPVGMAGIGPHMKLFRKSQEEWQDLPLAAVLKDETNIDILWGELPALYCARTDEEVSFSKSIITEAKAGGFECSWLDADQVKDVNPTLSHDVLGAVCALDYQVDSYRYTLALAQAAENMGAVIRNGEAVAFESEGSQVTAVVLASGTKIEGDKVVIATGPWSGRMGSLLKVNLPLTPVRAQMLKVKTPNPLPAYQTLSKHLSDSQWPGMDIIVSRRKDESILLGYSEEKLEDWDAARPETWQESPTYDMRDCLLSGSVELHPVLGDAELVEARSAILGYPPDLWPMLGCLPNWDNVYVGTGMGTMGIGPSPAVGTFLTDLIVGGERAKETAAEIKAFEPGRFE